MVRSYTTNSLYTSLSVYFWYTNKMLDNGPFRRCQANYLQRNACQGQPLAPGIHFFANIGKYALSYFREFATDFPETLQVN